MDYENSVEGIVGLYKRNSLVPKFGDGRITQDLASELEQILKQSRIPLGHGPSNLTSGSKDPSIDKTVQEGTQYGIPRKGPFGGILVPTEDVTIGDINFVGQKWYVGERSEANDSESNGRNRFSRGANLIWYMLQHVGESFSYAQISELTGWKESNIYLNMKMPMVVLNHSEVFKITRAGIKTMATYKIIRKAPVER